MPAFGSCSGNRSHLQQRGEPDIEKFEPLNIHLKQVPFAETFATPRHSSVVQPGSEPTLRVYGTIRCFPTTHLAPEIRTRRNKWALPSCLRFDPEFSEKTSPSEWQRLRVVSANFAEWLMGLPQRLDIVCAFVLCISEDHSVSAGFSAADPSMDINKHLQWMRRARLGIASLGRARALLRKGAWSQASSAG